jgi:hypothetical protein
MGQFAGNRKRDGRVNYPQAETIGGGYNCRNTYVPAYGCPDTTTELRAQQLPYLSPPPRRASLSSWTPLAVSSTLAIWPTGASWADLAIILIDTRKGTPEPDAPTSANLRFDGIRHYCVVVNKLDAVGYERTPFETVRDDNVALLGKFSVDSAVAQIEGGMSKMYCSFPAIGTIGCVTERWEAVLAIGSQDFSASTTTVQCIGLIAPPLEQS